MKIKVISDSLADIPKDLIDKYNIDVIPLTIIMNNIEYKDGVDISTSEFYKKLREIKQIPKTSQATYIQFVDIFNKYIDKYDHIIYISGSSKVTGTYQSSMMAKNDTENNDKIHVIDSLNLSYGCGCLVIKACEMINEGYDIDDILLKINGMKENTTILFAVDTLEYLQKGGRISQTKAIAGTMLRVKPILGIFDGSIQNISQVRGKKHVILELIKLVKEKYECLDDKRIVIGHGDNEEQFQNLKKEINKEFSDNELGYIEIGCTIGSHVGPGTIGICIYDK